MEETEIQEVPLSLHEVIKRQFTMTKDNPLDTKYQGNVVDEKVKNILQKERHERTEEEIEFCCKSLMHINFIHMTFKKYGMGIIKSIFKNIMFVEVGEKFTLVKHGDMGYNCFILFEGSCEVLIPGLIKIDGVSIYDMTRLNIINQGVLFGDKSIIDKKTRTASIRTLTKCYLGEFSKKEFLAVFENTKKIELNQDINFYKSVKLFAGCNRRFIEKFTYCMDLKDYASGEVAIGQNENIDKIFIIRRGIFDVVYKTDKTIDAIFDLNYFSEVNHNNCQRFTDSRKYEIKGNKKIRNIHKLIVLGPGEIYGDFEMFENSNISYFSLICKQHGSEILYCDRNKFIFNIGAILVKELQMTTKEKINNYRERFKNFKIHKKLTGSNQEAKLNQEIMERVLGENKFKELDSEKDRGKLLESVPVKDIQKEIDNIKKNEYNFNSRNYSFDRNNFKKLFSTNYTNNQDSIITKNQSSDNFLKERNKSAKKSNNKDDVNINSEGKNNSNKFNSVKSLKILNREKLDKLVIPILRNHDQVTAFNLNSSTARIPSHSHHNSILLNELLYKENANNNPHNNSNNILNNALQHSITTLKTNTASSKILKNTKYAKKSYSAKKSTNLKITLNKNFIKPKTNSSLEIKTLIFEKNKNKIISYNTYNSRNVTPTKKDFINNNSDNFSKTNSFNKMKRFTTIHSQGTGNSPRNSFLFNTTNNKEIFFLSKDTHILQKNLSIFTSSSHSKVPILSMNIDRPFYEKNLKTILKENSKFKYHECAEINKNFYLDHDNFGHVLKTKYNFIKKNCTNILMDK